MFLANLLIGIMYNSYVETFTDVVNYILENYPKLAIALKKEIAANKLTDNKLDDLCRVHFLKGHFDQKTKQLELFYKKTQDNDYE